MYQRNGWVVSGSALTKRNTATFPADQNVDIVCIDGGTHGIAALARYEENVAFSPDRDVVDAQVPLDHELLKVAEAEAEPEIPPDAHDDYLGFEMASLEQRRAVPSHPAQAYQTTSIAFATLPARPSVSRQSRDSPPAHRTRPSHPRLSYS